MSFDVTESNEDGTDYRITDQFGQEFYVRQKDVTDLIKALHITRKHGPKAVGDVGP